MRPANPWDAGASPGGASASSTCLSSELSVIRNPIDNYAASVSLLLPPLEGEGRCRANARHRGGVTQLHPHPARVLRTLADLPLQGEVGRSWRITRAAYSTVTDLARLRG